MKPTRSQSIALACDVRAARPETGAAIAEIVEVCARDVGQRVVVRTQVEQTSEAGVITLHLPAALAASQHPIWCLACRLACFCPTARVSVLVEAQAEFCGGRRTKPRCAA